MSLGYKVKAVVSITAETEEARKLLRRFYRELSTDEMLYVAGNLTLFSDDALADLKHSLSHPDLYAKLFDGVEDLERRKLLHALNLHEGHVPYPEDFIKEDAANACNAMAVDDGSLF